MLAVLVNTPPSEVITLSRGVNRLGQFAALVKLDRRLIPAAVIKRHGNLLCRSLDNQSVKRRFESLGGILDLAVRHILSSIDTIDDVVCAL